MLFSFHKNYSLFAGLIIIFASACSSPPKVSQSTVTENEAKVWFANYCSKGLRNQSGDIVVHANTKEFKGQYPANLRFEATGGFVLEVTSIIGGTILRLTSDGKEMQSVVPPKPRYNREHITHYLGLDLPILSELLLGDLPCPDTWKTGGIRVSANKMRIVTTQWIWNFEKADDSAGAVPVRVVLEPVGVTDAKLKIELLIESWDQAGHYAKKVSVKGPEGDLKWTWRNRD